MRSCHRCWPAGWGHLGRRGGPRAVLGLLAARDEAIFAAACAAGAIVVTKDVDFVDLLERRGPPPQVVWVTTGNVTNAALQALVQAAWPRAVDLLRAGEPLVELGDRR